MSERKLYPNFTALVPLQDKWRNYFEQYLAPRNTFEHYEDQVLGNDSRNNSPGWALSLSATEGFGLGTQQKVATDQAACEQRQLFISRVRRDYCNHPRRLLSTTGDDGYQLNETIARDSQAA
jgi:hypothetical protein